LARVDDRHDRGRLVGGAADDQGQAGRGGEHLVDRRDGVRRLTPGVHALAGQRVPEHAAVGVDGAGGDVAGGQVGGPERGIGAAEGGDIGHRQLGPGAGRCAGGGAARAAAGGERQHGGGGGGRRRGPRRAPAPDPRARRGYVASRGRGRGSERRGLHGPSVVL